MAPSVFHGPLRPCIPAVRVSAEKRENAFDVGIYDRVGYGVGLQGSCEKRETGGRLGGLYEGRVYKKDHG